MSWLSARLFAVLSGCFLLGAAAAVAMPFQDARLVVFARGETLLGDEFVAATEQVVDFLAALKRPQGPFGRINYDCSVKFRTSEPSVTPTGGTNPTPGYVPITMVYAFKDCVEAKGD